MGPAQISTDTKKTLSCAHGKIEELLKVLEPSIIIIHFFIIIINVYYNYKLVKIHNKVKGKGKGSPYNRPRRPRG
jgi:hypothetical protein